MKNTIVIGAPSKIGLRIVAEAPSLSNNEFERLWKSLGNPIKGIKNGLILGVDALYDVSYELPEPDGLIYWRCDYCKNAFSRYKWVVDKHELECPKKLDEGSIKP